MFISNRSSIVLKKDFEKGTQTILHRDVKKQYVLRRYEIKRLLAAAVTYHGHPLVEVMAEVKLCGCTNEGIVRRL